jgi:hypothetical protein
MATPGGCSPTTGAWRVNMGAYGGTREASISPLQWSYLGDLTNDHHVDFQDIAAFGRYWGVDGNCVPSDLDRDGQSSGHDVMALFNDWLDPGPLCLLPFEPPQMVIDGDVNLMTDPCDNSTSGQFYIGLDWWHKVVVNVSSAAGYDGDAEVRFECVSDGGLSSRNRIPPLVSIIRVSGTGSKGGFDEGWRVTYEGGRVIYDVDVEKYGGIGRQLQWRACVYALPYDPVCGEVHTIGPPPL